MMIRNCRPQDGAGIAPLLAQLGYPASPDQATRRVHDWGAGPERHLLVADVDQTVAGLAALCLIPLIHRDQPLARLVALVVDDRHRGTGIGHALLDRAEQIARQFGCDEMEITSNRSRAGAHRFYMSHGYDDWCEISARFRKQLTAGRTAPATSQ
jgi:GNAT superfamily N-acetyltransferase